MEPREKHLKVTMPDEIHERANKILSVFNKNVDHTRDYSRHNIYAIREKLLDMQLE